MPKINLKNSNSNTLVSLLKSLGIRYHSSKKQSEQGSMINELEMRPQSEKQKQQLRSVLQNYGTQLYHNTALNVDMNVDNFFNYSS